MRLFIGALALMFSLSSIAQSIYFTSLKDGKIKVEGSGFKGATTSYQVNFYRNSDYLTAVKTDSNGKFVYTSPTNTFKNNQKMIAKVLNFKGNGQHFEKSWEYRVTVIPEEKIKSYARQQAQTVANRVANTYGLRENFKYNFVNGFWTGYREFLQYAREGEPGYRHYKKGYEVGYSRGFSDGAEAGERDAKKKGDERGYSDANNNFLSAVDKGEPDTTVVVPIIANYGGANLTPTVPSVYDHLNELEYDFNQRLRDFSWSYDGYRLREFGSSWKLRNIYDSNGTYRFIETYFRSDYAHTEWRNNGLGGRYNYELYKKLNESQKSLFAKVFKNVYERVIDEKFLRVRNRRNMRAFTFGEDYGFMTGKKVVYDEGIKDGYDHGAAKSSVESFHIVFPRFYRTAFTKRVDFLSVNPVLILNDLAFNGDFYPTGTLNLVIKNLINYGGVQFQGAPSFSASHLTRSGSEEIELERLSSNQGQEIKGNNAVTINSEFPLETEKTIVVQLGNAKFRTSVKLEWATVLKNTALNNDLTSIQKETLKAYVFNSIKSEWSSQRGLKNLYKKGKNSLLERMVAFVDSNPESRGFYRKMVAELKSIPPKKVPLIKFALKKRKKSYLQMLKGLQ